MPASLRHAALARRVRLVCAGVEDRLDPSMTASTSAKAVYDAAGHTRTTFGGRKSTTTPRSVSASLSRSASGCSRATWPPRATCSRGVPTATSGSRSSTKAIRKSVSASDFSRAGGRFRPPGSVSTDPSNGAAASNGGCRSATHPPSRRGVLHVHLEQRRLLVAPPPRQRGRARGGARRRTAPRSSPVRR